MFDIGIQLKSCTWTCSDNDFSISGWRGQAFRYAKDQSSSDWRTNVCMHWWLDRFHTDLTCNLSELLVNKPHRTVSKHRRRTKRPAALPAGIDLLACVLPEWGQHRSCYHFKLFYFNHQTLWAAAAAANEVGFSLAKTAHQKSEGLGGSLACIWN